MFLLRRHNLRHNLRNVSYMKKPLLRFDYRKRLNAPKRNIFGGIIRSTIRLIKYPAILGAVGTGSAYAANKQIDDLREKFPSINFDNSAFQYLQYGYEESLRKGQELSKNISEAFGDKLKSATVPNENNSKVETLKSTEVNESKLRSKLLSELRNEVKIAKDEYAKELEKLKKENTDLRKELLLQPKKGSVKTRSNKSLIDMYSEVLDELADLDSSYNAQDQLPRVVVIGDQSSGKTSVLEMIAQARIFPRGAGEMMTRSPVKVTLSEGPYHVATFKDSPREYDLTSENDLAALRDDIEMKMKLSVKPGQTISPEVISLNVKGPGLQRIVLVDLPGIISTVTAEMDPNTRTAIRDLSKSHMSNPNAIILCIQDGSIDAERSNVTDLVSSIDPQGKRTIFVLTKVDLAETNLHNPKRIKKILQGKLFPMKALGYFAVVTGKGNQDDSIQSIKDYEEAFFSESKIFNESGLPMQQTTTRNLSKAVSERFWKVVRDSVEQQADSYRAIRFNLETEWKHNFPTFREMDRAALFDKARNEVLDLFLDMNSITSNEWEETIRKRFWSRIEDFVFDEILLPTQSITSYQESQIKLDILLKDWAKSTLPEKAIASGRESLYFYLDKVDKKNLEKLDPIFHPLHTEVLKEARRDHCWEEKALNRLKIIQTTALEDQIILDKKTWDDSVELLLAKVDMRIEALNKKIQELEGPNIVSRWLKWKNTTQEQKLSTLVIKEILTNIQNGMYPNLKLNEEDLNVIKRNLSLQHEIEVNSAHIENIYKIIAQRELLKMIKDSKNDYKKAYYLYTKGFLHSSPKNLVKNDNNVKDHKDFREVILFTRLNRMLQSTTNALRQQIINDETARMENIVKQKLNQIGEDPSRLKEIFNGKRVLLAEDLKRTRYIQEKLEEFIEALKNSER